MNKSFKAFLLIVPFFGLFGCLPRVIVPTVTMDPGSESVRTGKSDAPSDAKEIGPVSGVDGYGYGSVEGYMGTYERAVTILKNNAYMMGANYVQIMSIVEPHGEAYGFNNVYKISGTAYKSGTQSKQEAATGDATAQYKLGVAYDKGEGVPKDHDEAMKCYRKAAEQGNVDAQYELGAAYELGMGVPQNYAKAYFWSLLASSDHDPNHMKLRDRIATELDSATRVQVQGEASRWNSSPASN